MSYGSGTSSISETHAKQQFTANTSSLSAYPVNWSRRDGEEQWSSGRIEERVGEEGRSREKRR